MTISHWGKKNKQIIFLSFYHIYHRYEVQSPSPENIVNNGFNIDILFNLYLSTYFFFLIAIKLVEVIHLTFEDICA